MIDQSQTDYMMKGMCTPLGRVANMHQCISDLMPLGARDTLSMDLAREAAIAVDFPKTGVPPCIPNEGDFVDNLWTDKSVSVFVVLDLVNDLSTLLRKWAITRCP